MKGRGSPFSPSDSFSDLRRQGEWPPLWAWWITFYHIYNVDSILLGNYLVM
jgi:hypothetical protein